jgi:hypothetical protein
MEFELLQSLWGGGGDNFRMDLLVQLFPMSGRRHLPINFSWGI